MTAKPTTTKCGIICEYNPFHNGHLYHIQKTKAALNTIDPKSQIICVMSGDFVQRAQPAVFDKRVRAEAAVRAGADAVAELPAVFATAGGQQFAHGAIQILSQIEGVRYLSFGVETDRPELLETIAEIQLNESNLFKTVLRDALKNGVSYPVAITNATTAEFENLYRDNADYNQLKHNCQKHDDSAARIKKDLITQILNAPNNVLGIEYLKAIKRKNLNIKPVFIKRTDKGYNSLELTPPFASASAIRTLIAAGKHYTDFTPFDYGKNIVDFDLFDGLIRTALLTKNPPAADLPLSKEVFEKLKKAAAVYHRLDDIIMSAKSKNHTYAALKRFCLQVMCDITPEILDYDGEIFAKMLYMKKSFKPHLKDLGDRFLISSADEKLLHTYQKSSKTALDIYNIDKKISDIYSVITRQNSSRHFNKIF